MKAKEYVAAYKTYLENPPKVYGGVPEGVEIPVKEAALVKTLQNLLAEGVDLLKRRCGTKPTTSASMGVLRELDNKFTKIREALGDDSINPYAFEVYLTAVQPEVGAAYYIEKSKVRKI